MLGGEERLSVRSRNTSQRAAAQLQGLFLDPSERQVVEGLGWWVSFPLPVQQPLEF